MSALFWLTDEQMERLRPFFPKSRGKPRVDDRRVLRGIVFVNRNGIRWRDAASDYWFAQDGVQYQYATSAKAQQNTGNASLQPAGRACLNPVSKPSTSAQPESWDREHQSGFCAGTRNAGTRSSAPEIGFEKEECQNAIWSRRTTQCENFLRYRCIAEPLDLGRFRCGKDRIRRRGEDRCDQPV